MPFSIPASQRAPRSAGPRGDADGHVQTGWKGWVNRLDKIVSTATGDGGESRKLGKKTRGLLNQVFAHAFDLEALLKNPVAKTKLPKASRLKAEQKEDAEVISAADPNYCKCTAKEPI